MTKLKWVIVALILVGGIVFLFTTLSESTRTSIDEWRTVLRASCEGRGMGYNRRHGVCIDAKGVMYTIVVESKE